MNASVVTVAIIAALAAVLVGWTAYAAADRIRTHLRDRRTTSMPDALDWLSVSAWDRGRSVHLIPGDADDHAVADDASCHCRPSRSLCRRSTGHLVIFVDHQLLAHPSLTLHRLSPNGRKPR